MARALRFGVIGAGGIARRKTIPGLLRGKNCALVAVMDVANADAIAREFGGVRAYTDEKEILADPDVEAVYIASPVSEHLRQIRAAAAAKKQILCEKPLAMTVRQAKEAVAACRRNKVFLQEGYMMKFHGAHANIRRMIVGGRLGTLVYLRAQLSCWYPPIPGAWRQDPTRGGGGSLIDMATHLYDLLEFFAGPIRQVSAFTGNLVQAYPAEDAATTLLRFASGAQATVDTFFCVPDEASSTRLEIYGSAGAILTEGTIGQGEGGCMKGIFGLGADRYDAGQNKEAPRNFQDLEFPRVNPYTAECEYFAEHVLSGRAPEVNHGKSAIHLLDVMEKAYRSARVGKTQTVAP